MYNRRNAKPGMSGLDIAPKEIFLTYSTQFIFLTIRLVPGNVVMVAIDMCGKNPITGEWIYGIKWKHVYINISALFIVNTTSTLKSVVPTAYCFCLDGHLGGCAVAIVVAVVVVVVFVLFCLLFIYLFNFFCRFGWYSYLCCHYCHPYCCFCCWCHRCLFCVCGYCCC